MQSQRIQKQQGDHTKQNHSARKIAKIKTPSERNTVNLSRFPVRSGATHPDISLTPKNVNFLQRTIGNRAVKHMIQAKPFASEVSPLILRQTEVEDKDEEPAVQAKEKSWQRPTTTRGLESRIYAQKGSGEPIFQLQETVGNQTVEHLLCSSGIYQTNTLHGTIQRASNPPSPAVDPVKQQWEADWNDPVFASQRRHFRGEGRPRGTAKQRYDILCPLYRANGVFRPLKYIKDNIRTAKFFKFVMPAHKDLKPALATAESTLRGKGYKAAPVDSAWSFNPRTTSEGGWSDHAMGKAIDFDPDINPRLTGSTKRKIITLLTGYDIEKENPGEAFGLSSYESAKAASGKFQELYNPSGMRAALQELKDQQDLLENRMENLKEVLKHIPQGRKASREERQQAREIGKLIKEKRSEIKKVIKNRKLLRKELRRYEALDESVDRLSGAVLKLQQDVELLEAQLADSEGRERTMVKRELKKKRRALKSNEKKLSKKEQLQKKHRLRRYARSGFLNLPKDLVNAMKGAGLEWGGDWKQVKDFMHFEIS